jgi:hypothetical protein
MSSNQDGMGCTLVVPQCEDSRLEAQRQEIALMLADLVADIRDLQGKIRSGEATKAELAVGLADLRYWLKAARETEAELDAIKRKESDVVSAYGLDLEAAELEIGCRLARIRPCCGAARVP